MSEILKIDTSAGILPKKNNSDPLPLFNENFPLLKEVMPDYVDYLPNNNMKELVTRLKITKKKYNGLGLSANQCGVKARVFVIGYGDDTIACINPKVVNQSEELVKDKEGCLSFPGMFLTIPRHKWIEVEFISEDGQKVNMRMEGITARCFMHELDHMNGIVYTDHVGPLSVNLAKQKQNKLIKKMKRMNKGK